MNFVNPVFKFTLTHEIEGVFFIDEPLGWPGARLILERDSEYSSLIERFDGAFTFFGDNGIVNGGISIIKFIENKYGLDADLEINADISFDGGVSWQNVFNGLYDFSENEENNLNQIKSAIIRNDFWTKFINRSETQVDLQSSTGLDGSTIDVISPINISLSSQIISKSSTYNGSIVPTDPSLPEYNMPTGGAIDASGPTDDFTFYSQATIDIDQNEIDDSFQPILDFINVVSDITPNIELPEEGGVMDIYFDIDSVISLTLDGEIFASSEEVDPSAITSIDVGADIYLQKNNDSPIFMCGGVDSSSGVSTPHTGLPVLFTKGFDISLSAPGHQTITTSVNDSVKLYVVWSITFNIDVGANTGVIKWSSRTLTLDRFEPRAKFVIASTYKDTTAEAFLIHDAARSIIDRITGVNSSLQSNYLGNSNTSPSYVDDGCASNFVCTKGLQIRGYLMADKRMQMSFKQWWDGAHPIFNFGLGYTDDNKIEIEPREYFYDDEMSVLFDNVENITRRYDQDKIFNKIDIGFQKWQSENISGIDDPQTKHSYATRFKKVGKSISILSDWIAASLAIETTRRAKKKKSADYKYDDETFIISVNASTLNPELDENFSTISNLNNSDTRYNIRLSPSRILVTNWFKYINGALQSYIGSFYKFVSGEGNYNMVSDITSGCNNSGPIAEDQNFQIYNDVGYLHLADLFEIKIPMTWEQYSTIRQNRKKAIGISRTTYNHTAFFIKVLEYEVSNALATITAWPKTPFNIDRVSTYTHLETCASSECGPLGRSTEENNFRITENGLCREIE